MLEKKGKLLLVFCALFQLTFAESINEKEIEQMVAQIIQNSQQSSTLSADEIANITDIVKQKLKAKEKEKKKVTAPSTAEEINKQSNALNDILSGSPENSKPTEGTVNTYNKVILEEKHVSNKVTTGNTSALVSSLSKEADERTREMRHVVVKNGDTLSGIAYNVYGSIVHYTKIYEANDDILRNPDKIYIGQRLRVPE